MNVVREYFWSAIVAQSEAPAHTYGVGAGAVNHGCPKFKSCNVLEKIVAVFVLAVLAENHITERAQNQVATGRHRTLPQSMLYVGVIRCDALVLRNRQGFLLPSPGMHHNLYTLNMHRFLPHVHQQTQCIRVLVLGVVDDQIGAVISFVLQEKELKVDDPDNRHYGAADRADVVHWGSLRFLFSELT
ncbi:hypothetical protein MARHY3126 [Marinobacter nauticus ATCC 49840]|nr:hypothetical protein MARHY3126 [Marinobacter nauticus ATCC 49840]